MARGRPRKGANPAAEFERTVKRATRPPPRLTLAGQPGQPAKKPYRDMNEEERFLFKRDAFIRNLTRRVPQCDKQLDLLLNLSNRETYKYAAKEGERLVARLRAWVDAIEESFQRRNPYRPIDLPPVTLESSETVLWETIRASRGKVPAPQGMEDVWG